MSPEATVYILAADRSMREAGCALLGAHSIPVTAYASAQQMLRALKGAKSEPLGLMLSLDLPDENTISLVQQLRDEGYTFPIIAASSNTEAKLRQQVVDAGATELLDRGLVHTYIARRLAELQADADSSPGAPHSVIELSTGAQVTFRVMHPEDAQLEQEFVKSLSERSRYLRFFSGIRELPPSLLKMLMTIVFPISFALIATIAEGEGECQIGEARYAPTETAGTAEFALVVADAWQGHGIGSRLLQGIITAAVAGGADRLEGLVLKENLPMIKLAQKMGFVEAPGHSPEPSALLFVKIFR